MENEISIFTKLIKQTIGSGTDRKVRGMFGLPLSAIVLAWQFIKDANYADRSKLLITLNYLWTYPTEIVGANTWKLATVTYKAYIMETAKLLLIRLPQVKQN